MKLSTIIDNAEKKSTKINSITAYKKDDGSWELVIFFLPQKRKTKKYASFIIDLPTIRESSSTNSYSSYKFYTCLYFEGYYVNVYTN